MSEYREATGLFMVCYKCGFAHRIDELCVPRLPYLTGQKSEYTEAEIEAAKLEYEADLVEAEGCHD